jgi:uncharacterized membrane protein YkoI
MKLVKFINSRVVLIFVFFLLFFGLTANSFAQHKKYKESDMPKAVIETFNKMYPNATVIGYDIENEDGNKFYEIESKEGNISRDLQFNEDGSISEIEEQMNISDLPDKVVSAINTKYPNGTILKAEKVTKNSETLYETVVKNGKKKHEVRVNSGGDIISVE